jgi:hypothetical protein
MSAAGVETRAARWWVRRNGIPDPVSFSQPHYVAAGAAVSLRSGTLSKLTGEPRPPESFPAGSPYLRRLRAPRYGVFYTIDEERRVIQIDHVARLP